IDAYPDRLNAASYLLDPANGGADLECVRSADRAWTRAELTDRVGRLGAVLVDQHGVRPGTRVLVRGLNSPEMVAAILAVMHVGGVVVPTMPLLRAAELDRIADRSETDLVLTDHRLRGEVDAMARSVTIAAWGDGGDLDAATTRATPRRAEDTAADEVAMLLFTSGTTGVPKAACQLHRDVAAICETVGAEVYALTEDDVVCGTPPLAFAYGFGAFLAFPLRAGASVVLLEQPGPGPLLDAIERHGVTVLFTAPTAYRALIPLAEGRDLSSVRYGASAGETLPASTWDQFHEATGITLLDGIGSTEMLHVFLSNRLDAVRPGSTGLDVPGYRCRLVDDDGTPLGPGEIGHLEVQGPTGCLYLDDERQSTYVRDGWNRTGDLYELDGDGWYHYRSRADDMIVSSGYNVAGPEVEAALLTHPAVAECGVVGLADDERGQVITAFVVPAAGVEPSDDLARSLQDHVKATIAPYKYPRSVHFLDELPKTGTGKVQRFRLRDLS
ncbi:MAG: AMP-binding protein, partial [Actinomycetota bacterium]